MSGQSRTPDELFLIKLFEIASSKGNPLNQVKAEVVSKAIHQTERSVRNIIKLLAQANFIIKGEGTLIRLTKHGLKFVERELE